MGVLHEHASRKELVAENARLRLAIATAVTELGNWLTDRTDKVFEEEPEIDGIRADLDAAL